MKQSQIYLIVDDDADDIEFFCEAIDNLDKSATCYIAHDGEEALKILRKKSDALPDYIFLDLNMPRMDGKTCLSEIKNNSTLKHLPVIIYTTSNHQKDRDETALLGASHYMVKPTSYKALQRGIIKAVVAVVESKSSKVR